MTDSEQTDHAVLSARMSLKDLADEYERDVSDGAHLGTNARGIREVKDSTSPEVERNLEPGLEMGQNSTSPKGVGKNDPAVDDPVEDFVLMVKEQLTMGEEISQEEITTRVNDLDGGFFESYVRALEMVGTLQEVKRKKFEDEVEDEEKPMERSDEPDRGDLDEIELEELYRSLLRTVQYWLGITDANRKAITSEMHSYMKKTFGTSDSNHQTWMDDELKLSEPPQHILRVSIIDGKNLPPKDPNGLSDPFCVIGLVELDPGALSGKKKTKHLRDLIKDESQLRTTQVIQESLNPVWNEEFELTVGNFNTQYLQIDIWDSDEEAETVGNALKSHVKGFAGIGRYFRQVAETTFRGAQDDFMGRVYIPLRELPPQGIDSAFHIQSKRQHTKKGELHVKVQLVAEQKTRRQSLSPQDAFTEHTKLQNLFIDHESREFIKHGGAYWHGQLSSPALQMLDQHAIQNNMTELDHVICEWIVVVEHNEKQGVDYKYILQVIERLREQWGEVQQKVGNPEKELGQGKVQLLLNAMRGFREWSYSMLAKLRVIYPANNKKALTKLENLLKCLKKFYEFELIKQKLPGQNFNLFVAGAIKQSTSSWLAERQALLEPQVTTDDALTMAVVELVSDIVVDLYQAVDVYNVLMEPMGVDYIGLVFKQIDILLSPVVETKMKDANQKFLDLEIESEEFRLLSVASFQLYLSITELNRFKSHLPEQTVASSKLFQNLHAWFEPMVTRWIDLADLKTIARIDKAVELDEVKGVSDSAKYSTSAVDTSLCLLHVCDIWKKLAWPLSPAAFEFVVRLAKVTCKGASHYTERMHIILERTGYYDAEGQFDVTVQLCITLNNINYVRKTLDTLPDCLKWDQLVSDLDLSGDSEAAESSRAKLWGQVTSANNGIVKKRSQIISRIGEKMGADILGYVLPLVTSPESTPAHDSMSGLMKYLASNLQTLSNNLMVDIFRLVLYEIYCVLISKLLEVVDGKHNVTPKIADRLLSGLKIIQPFFSANGHGLEQKTMETKEYRQLEAILKLKKMDTRDLVCKYFSELAEQQAGKKEFDRGALKTQVGFLSQRGQLCIKLLNGHNLPALDPATGTSDPYVTVQPFPRHLFEDKSGALHKSKTQKGTLTPIFDETFFIRSRPSTLEVEGSAILFTCYDWDMITKDDLIGEAVVLLSQVKVVDVEKDVEQLKQIMLPLSLPAIPTDRQSAYYALQGRTWDKAAMEFIKIRKKIFKKADSERK